MGGRRSLSTATANSRTLTARTPAEVSTQAGAEPARASQHRSAWRTSGRPKVRRGLPRNGWARLPKAQAHICVGAPPVPALPVCLLTSVAATAARARGLRPPAQAASRTERLRGRRALCDRCCQPHSATEPQVTAASGLGSQGRDSPALIQLAGAARRQRRRLPRASYRAAVAGELAEYWVKLYDLHLSRKIALQAYVQCDGSLCAFGWARRNAALLRRVDLAATKS